MRKEAQEVKTYRVVARCECGGEYKPTGVALSTYPEQFPHVCDTCGKQETYYERYPMIVYESTGKKITEYGVREE